MFWRAYRAEGWRGWVLPAAVAAEVGWAVFLWRDYAGFLPWARDLLLAAGAVAVVALIAARLSRRARARVVTVALGAGVAAMLAAPATWAASVLDVAYAGSSFNATAGPAGMGGGPGGGGFASGGAGGGAPGGIGSSAAATLTCAEQRLYDYVSAHRDGAGYLMAVDSWESASPVHPRHRAGGHAHGRLQRLGTVPHAGGGQATGPHRAAQVLPDRRRRRPRDRLARRGRRLDRGDDRGVGPFRVYAGPRGGLRRHHVGGNGRRGSAGALRLRQECLTG
jgi:hypothetical protein